MNPDTQETLRGAAEIALASPLVTAPAWFHYLAEINVVLATVSLSIGILLGAHGLFRIARSYVKKGR